jgi:hypothetical protein
LAAFQVTLIGRFWVTAEDVSGKEMEGYVKEILAITPRVKGRLQFLFTKKKKKKS